MVRVVRLERTVSWSQTRRDTNFAIPGYSLFCHDTTASGKNKVFSVCGHLCGQRRFCAAFCNRGKSRKRRRRKALRRFASLYPGYNHGTPKPGAIPTSLYPDIQFLPLYHGEGENQRFFCLWSFMWSNPLLRRFQQPGKVPQTQASQDFAAFRLTLPRIQPRHSQASALPTALHPDTVFTLHRKSVFDSPNSILDFGRKVNRPVAYPARIAYNKNITQYIKECAL